MVREANNVADWMTHHGHLTNSLSWFESPDVSFFVIIRPYSWIPLVFLSFKKNYNQNR